MYRETKVAMLAELLQNAPQRRLIARGLGRSYGDAALNRDEGVVDLSGRDRLISFDEVNGILECEAGVSLACIVETLLPHGWFLPVTPGTKLVTVGGAIAADVHGKNHHIDGTLGRFVIAIDVMLADGSVRRCSREENQELFLATVGGMGLTGLILGARIRLRRVPSPYIRQVTLRCANIDAALEQLDRTKDSFRYSVAWIDCLARGRSLGRTVLMLGNEASRQEVLSAGRETSSHHPKSVCTVPAQFPGWILNSATVKAFNGLYYRQREGERLVHYENYFYPLDSLYHWNRIYGKNGFIQYQAVLPHTSAQRGLTEMLEAVSSAGLASFLAVLKKSGEAAEGLLSFLTPGYTLALDIPNRGERTRQLARTFDRILLRHGGRIYLAKDATTDAETFSTMYPALSGFRAIKERVDPKGRFSSSLSRRLGIG